MPFSNNWFERDAQSKFEKYLSDLNVDSYLEVGVCEGRSFLWVADRSAGIAKKAFVTLGAVANGGLVEVTEGLDLGSRIVTQGIEGLRDGDRINIIGEDDRT